MGISFEPSHDAVRLGVAEYEFSKALEAMLEVTRKSHLMRLDPETLAWLKQQIEEVEHASRTTD